MKRQMQYNRWHVYEFLKETFMFSGRVTPMSEVRRKLPDIDEQELREGCVEFTLATKRLVPEKEVLHG